VVIALAALGWWKRTPFVIAALIASVALDLDHVPGYFNALFLTHGTPRPYTHSLMTVVLLVVVALVVENRWREVLLGLAVGTSLHLFRDMSEPDQAGVALFWPLSNAGFRLPYALYGSTMVVLVVVAAVRRGRRLA
jgi:inner membrane protein